MTPNAADVWTDDTSVLFTSFWGWAPETWGTVGWTGDSGSTRRANLLKELSDPFICVGYVTSKRTESDPGLKGMIGGFYLVSHETGDRNAFTHPIHHNDEPDRWRHSLRALRAFSYLPEYRLRALEVFPDLSRRARNVAAMGKIITDPAKINQLRSTPWIEVPVYSSRAGEIEPSQFESRTAGMVRAGPASSSGYLVEEGSINLPRELYILRLDGDTNGFLGRAIEGAIYKIGLSVSPDLRRQNLQKSMPRGAFQWRVFKTTCGDGNARYKGFEAAVTGEYAMKQHLAKHSEWLGGEFYLATEAAIETAWQAGREAAEAEEAKQGKSDG